MLDLAALWEQAEAYRGVAVRNIWRALLRLGFRLLYREMAWSYDLVSRVVSLEEVSEAAADILAGRIQGRVLVDPNL